MERFFKFAEPVVCNDEVNLGHLSKDPTEEYLVLRAPHKLKFIGSPISGGNTAKVTHISENDLDSLVQIVSTILFTKRLGKINRIYNPISDNYLPIVVSKTMSSSKDLDYIISAEDWCLIPEDFKKKSPYRNWLSFRENGVLNKTIEKDTLINDIMRVISQPWNNPFTMAWGYITETEEGNLVAGANIANITELDFYKKEVILSNNGVIYRSDVNYPKWQPTPDIK